MSSAVDHQRFERFVGDAYPAQSTHPGPFAERAAHRVSGMKLAIVATVGLWTAIGTGIWGIVSFLN